MRRVRLARNTIPLRQHQPRPYAPALEVLEDRRLLTFTVNHTPYLQLGDAPLTGYNAGADQTEIVWQTTGAQDSDTFTAEFRLSGTLGWTSAPLNPQIATGVETRINHSATLKPLNFDTDYDYQITHYRAGSPIATYTSTFHTRLPAGDDTAFTFVAYGDSAATNPANYRAVQAKINQVDPRFSLLLGDNVYDSGTHAEFDNRLSPALNPELTTYNKNHVDYYAMGNHDSATSSGQPSRDNYSVPVPVQGVTSPVGLTFDANVQAEENYSFDYGSVHFVTFDSNNWQNAAALTKQLDWAVTDIAAAKDAGSQWIVVFAHHPLASLSGHLEHTPDDNYYDQVVARLGASGAGVDLLLVGHTHNYQRSYPLTGRSGATATYVLDNDNDYAKGAGLVHVVQGTGGAALGYGASDATFANSFVAHGFDSATSVLAAFGFGKIDVTPTQLTYSYLNTAGQVLDSFTITDGPDTFAPTAALTAPVDNGLGDNNPAVDQVAVGAAQSLFEIQLSDTGDGIDDATVTSAAVSVTRNLQPLTAGIDYTFSYDSLANRVTLTALNGSFGEGDYEISLSSAIQDQAGNSLVDAVFAIEIDFLLPRGIAFQQGLNGYTGTVDTYVHEDEPGTSHGANVKVYADGDDDLGTAETPPQRVQGLIRFDNLFASRGGGAIPDGATIQSAILTVRTGTASGDVSASTFDLHRMLSTWNENSTWNSMASGVSLDNLEAASTATASVVGPNSAGAAVQFDVTADLQLWSANGALATLGWVINPRTGTDGWWFDSSNGPAATRPTLTIIYTPASIIGRHIFYNQSKFDGNSDSINTSDDAAIATDKSAYLAGSGQATFANTTSYSRGINGIMLDLSGSHPSINAADFTFKVGNNNNSSLWPDAPAPAAVVVRPGAGSGGADRVEITWANNAIQNTWLQVTLKANAHSGLSAADTFYFGNRIGNSGLGDGALLFTSPTDEIGARTHSGLATVTNVFDFDRNGFVSPTDSLIARSNSGSLVRINLAAPPAPASPIESFAAEAHLPPADDRGDLALSLSLEAPQADAAPTTGEIRPNELHLAKEATRVFDKWAASIERRERVDWSSNPQDGTQQDDAQDELETDDALLDLLASLLSA